MGLKKYDVVEIKWVDAKIDTEPKEIKNKEYEKVEPEERYTIGYFLYKDKNKIIIAATKDKDTVADINVIPMSWKINIKKLEKVK